MTKLEQAARRALEALKWYVEEDDVMEAMPGNEPWVEGKRNAEKAITALREALEEMPKTAALEQESAWIANDWSVFNTGAEVASGLSLNDAMDYLTDERAARGWSVVCVINKDNMPTPAAPQPTRQPLTDKQIDEIADQHRSQLNGQPYFAWYDYARAIEEALWEKNS